MGVDCCMEAVGAVERIGAAGAVERIGADGAVGRIGAVGHIGGLEGMMVVAGTKEVSSLWRRVREGKKFDEPVAVDSELRSEVDSNVYWGDAGCCRHSATAAGLGTGYPGTSAVEGGFRLVSLLAAKLVVDVAAARSLRCREGAVHSVPVDGVESSVNRRSSHLLPFLYVVNRTMKQVGRRVETVNQAAAQLSLYFK